MNQNRSDHRSIVADAGGKTGKCFSEIVSIMVKHADTCKSGLFENVIGLQVGNKDPETGSRGGIETSNLATCVRILFAAGFFAVTVCMEPRRFGHPQHRPHLYLVVYSRRVLEELGMSYADTYNLTTSLLERVSQDHGMTR